MLIPSMQCEMVTGVSQFAIIYTVIEPKAMLLLIHEDEYALKVSVDELLLLGERSRLLLGRCVEEQEVIMGRLPKSANQLDRAGFIRVSDIGDIWEKKYLLTPTLLGEEVIEFILDEIETRPN